MRSAYQQSAPDSVDEPQSFWDHVDALRSVLIRASVLLAITTVGLFALMPRLFDSVILAPCRTDFPTYRWLDTIAGYDFLGTGAESSPLTANIELINIELASQFMIHMSASFWLALVVSAPALIVLLWGFISPALFPNERATTRMGLAVGTVMFYVGVATNYFILFPLTLRFLAGYQLSPLIPNMISISSYIDTFWSLSLVMGLMFELPLAAWILGRAGILTRGVFTRYRRHAVVALTILAAIITPTGDPFTLAVVFIPLYLLWEASAWLVPSQCTT